MYDVQYSDYVVNSIVDPDPTSIHIQQLCGSGSVFLIRILIHSGENRINKREKE